MSTDVHSFTDGVRHTAIALELEISLDPAAPHRGVAVYRFPNEGKAVLDLGPHVTIDRMFGNQPGEVVAWWVGESDPVRGSPLTIVVPPSREVRCFFSVDQQSTALQLLTEQQTTDKTHKLLYSQCQAINARDLFPCQDSPAVRFTLTTSLVTPPGYIGLAVGKKVSEAVLSTGQILTRHQVPHPIPAYLFGLAVGDLICVPLTDTCGVWAERSVVGRAAAVLEDLPRFVEIGEQLFGPNRWDGYWALVLPWSFPFGGMENAMLSFYTSLVLAPDKSMIYIPAHEVGHNWAGNLVNYSCHGEAWINEGFNTYIEMLLLEGVYGLEWVAIERAIAHRAFLNLLETLKGLPAHHKQLRVPLGSDEHPDEMTSIPYHIGDMLFLRLEEAVGRERMLEFLRTWFDRFAFQAVTTDDFIALVHELLPDALGTVPLMKWIDTPWPHADAPKIESPIVDEVIALAESLALPSPAMAATWSSRLWNLYLKSIPRPGQGPVDIKAKAMCEELDAVYGFSRHPSKVLCACWLRPALVHGVQIEKDDLAALLGSVGSQLTLKLLFTDILSRKDLAEWASDLYRHRLREQYHPITVRTIDAVFAKNTAPVA